MHEQDYFNEIKSIIENAEVNKKVREYKNNYEDLMAKWNIGKLLMEAQGGEKRAKYGDNLIKRWSEIFVNEYGKQYSVTNLKYMRQFYSVFLIGQPLVGQLTWSHIIKLLPIKNENDRKNIIIKHFYIVFQIVTQCVTILCNVSKRCPSGAPINLDQH